MKDFIGRKKGIISAAAIVVLSFAASLFSLCTGRGEVITISYSFAKEVDISVYQILTSALAAIAVCGVYFAVLTLLKPEEERKIGGKNLAFFILLSAMGVIAFAVISVLLTAFGASLWVSYLISALAVLTYFLLVYKLYFEEKINSNALFWEIFRFAIVGVIAAAFDFAIAFSVQFFIFKDSALWFVTALSTASGFAVGVAINYLLSNYMVYKAAKSGFSKTFKGAAAFVVLSAVGLFIGIGLQYLLYDFLYLTKSVAFLTYPVDFVIRTLVVMVYNYASRKLIIYR